jgi:hypothetical protein
MAPISKVTALLALSAASPTCDAFAFAPGPRLLQRRQASVVSLSASNRDENAIADGWRKVSGSAAAFLTGMGIMAQLALADPTVVGTMNGATVAHAQSSSVLLSLGAPAFGGGSSFDTLDFSLPSYDQATSGGDITKSSSPAPSAAPKIDDSAAKAAAKEEREASRRAEAEAKEAQKKADEAAAKEAAEKAAAKDAAKEERKVRFLLIISNSLPDVIF